MTEPRETWDITPGEDMVEDRVLEIYAKKMNWYRGVEIYVTAKKWAPSRRFGLSVPLRFESLRECERLPPTPLMFGGLEIQRLMDDLWECGVRPSRPQELNSALEGHLADMRQIAFGKLKLEKPR